MMSTMLTFWKRTLETVKKKKSVVVGSYLEVTDEQAEYKGFFEQWNYSVKYNNHGYVA